MITVEEFAARVQNAADRHGKATARNEELFKELQALCVLAGVSVSRSGDHVYVYRDEGGDRQQIMSGPLGEVVEALAAPAPDDGPFGFFRNLHFGVTVPAALGDDGPVHIERRDLVLLSELVQSLGDYLDALA